jgi:apolipoprotein N-acyltransferase
MSPFTFLMFFAFIPLLYLSNLNITKGKYFFSIYLAMFIWNVSTTWWIWYASPPGAISAFLANSLLMTLPWLLYRLVKQKFSATVSYIALIAFWMMWEYTHLQDWGLSWPWLTIGNVFASQPNWIQWYEYTGVSGGTLWVLIGNIFMFYLNYNKIIMVPSKKFFSISFLQVFLILIVPIFYSFFIKSKIQKQETENIQSVVITQPNIDPYEKLSTGTFEAQLNNLINTSKTQLDSNTALLIWPETALYNEYRFDENDINGNHKLDTLFTFLQQYPKLYLFTGIESYKYFKESTSNSRIIPNTDIHYESYNSSVLLHKDGAKQYYHKSMLVPGVETLPSFLNFMGKWFEELGGTTNGYVKQKERTPIVESATFKLAPSICYESIYGEFMSKFINNGANVITIITNDGWWRNTPGHRQHFAYAKLRAIENRTSVLRSANTGISGFISPNGEVLEKLEYNKNGALKYAISTQNNYKTFYTKHPDLLYKIFVVLAVLLMVYYNISIWLTRKI